MQIEVTAENDSDNDQGLSKDLETGYLNLMIVKSMGVHFFEGCHGIQTTFWVS